MKSYANILKLIGLILVVNLIANQWSYRVDLTKDKRYTLSLATKEVLKRIDKPVKIKVYLKGDFPLDFKRLGTAVKEHLEELKVVNGKINYTFINPMGIEDNLLADGMQPSRLTMEEEGKVSQKLIFPYAVVKMGVKQQVVNLLSSVGHTQEEQLTYALENIEFAFSDALHNLMTDRKKTLAILRSHGTLEDVYLYNFLSGLKAKYNLAPFTLNPDHKSSVEVLKDLTRYDGLIIAKPTEIFSEENKFVLDQYVMQGGKTLWMLDHVIAEMDSLQEKGSTLVIPRDLNLTDLLFSYGVRINHTLVEDLYSSKIALATGNVGGKTQFTNLLWYHYPVILGQDNNPVTKGLEPIRVKFPSNIDTLPSTKIKKTPLLQTSKLSRVSGLPIVVDLASISNEVKPEDYNAGRQLVGVLLEGQLPSAYAHRTKPFTIEKPLEVVDNKMMVIADGDIAANQIQSGQPTPLNIDKWTGQTFGNKDFLINAVNYLMDDADLLNIRRKTLDLVMLNKETVAKQKPLWQWLNIGLPLLMLGVFGLVYGYVRRKKYIKADALVV